MRDLEELWTLDEAVEAHIALDVLENADARAWEKD